MDLINTKLESLAEFRNGKALSPDKYSEAGAYEVFGSNGPIARSNDFLYDRPVIVIGRVGAYCGAVYATNEKAWVTDNAIVAEPKPGVNLEYLYYKLKSLDLNRTAIGSAQPLLTQSGLKAISTTAVIGEENQANQVKILTALDQNIKLNRKINETLESMARAIFKSWFIDFDPVHAKAQGKKPFGMDDATAALFPIGFNQSEFGKIPVGWSFSDLGNLCSYLSRGIGPSYIENGGVRVFNQKCIRNGVASSAQARRHDPSIRAIEGRALQSLDILVNSTGTGTLGRVGQLSNLQETSIVDSHVTVVRADIRKISPYLLGLDLRTRETEIEALAEGSTGQTELSKTRLSQIKILVPSPDVQRAANNIIQPMIQLLHKNLDECNNLEKMRDLLLPRLLSGELKIKEAA